MRACDDYHVPSPHTGPCMRSIPAFLVRCAAAAYASAFTAVALAQASAPAASQALPAIKAPAAVANPYGLQAMWTQGDWVARITILILAVMSLASWYVL